MSNKRGISLIAVAFVGLLAIAVASADKTKTSRSPVPIRPADLKWVDLDPTSAPGVKVADLWGDHTRGPFGAMFKLPAGFAAPLHTHTHDMKVVIVSGSYLQAPEGKAEFALGPGSFLLQPGGNYRHTTRCDTASECVFMVISDGAFDLLPARADLQRHE